MTDYLDYLNGMPTADGRPSRTPTAGTEPIGDAVLAMAYVPVQKLTAVFEDECALNAGTLFPDLEKPFLGKKGCGK